MIEVVGVTVRKGKGYIPVHAQIEGGPYFMVEPVFVANLTVDDLVAALEKAIAFGHPQIPPPTQEEMKQRTDPMLAAAGVKSWYQLAKGGADYSIFWSEDRIVLYMSRLDRKGRFESDPNKTKNFGLDTPLQAIVETILADIKTRPELDWATTAAIS